MIYKCLYFFVFSDGLGELGYPSHEEWVVCLVREDLDPVHTSDQRIYFHPAFTNIIFQNPFYFNQCSNCMKVRRSRFIYIRVFLHRNNSQRIGLEGIVDCSYRALAAENEDAFGVWENDSIADRDNGVFFVF